MASNDQIFEMLQNNNNHILELVKKTEKLSGTVGTLDKTIDKMKDEHSILANKSNELHSLISSRMTPDRCGHMHNELTTRIKKEVFLEIKQGAHGWVAVALTIFKFMAYVSLVFGGSAVGAQALGIIKITGG